MNDRHDDSAAKAANDMADQIASLTAALATAEEALHRARRPLADLNGKEYLENGQKIEIGTSRAIACVDNALSEIKKARGKV